MSTARHGISDHRLVEIYEVFRQQAERLGDTDRDAHRAACIIAFRFAGMNAEQAIETTNKIAAQRKQQGGVAITHPRFRSRMVPNTPNKAQPPPPVTLTQRTTAGVTPAD